MHCKTCQQTLPDYLMNRLEKGRRKEIADHLKTCEDCRKQMETLAEAWYRLDGLPEKEPGPGLRSRFYAMLEAEKRTQDSPVPLSHRVEAWIRIWWPHRPILQAAFSAALLLIGLGIGRGFSGRPQEHADVASLREEIQEMRQTVSLSLLNQQSSTERLKAIGWSSRISRPDTTLLQALLSTLDSDPNVNVRIAAADALLLFSDRPNVRDGLLGSLERQQSPLVQAAIIDVLVQIREKRALDALRQLIENSDSNPAIRIKAQKGIEQLT